MYLLFRRSILRACMTTFMYFCVVFLIKYLNIIKTNKQIKLNIRFWYFLNHLFDTCADRYMRTLRPSQCICRQGYPQFVICYRWDWQPAGVWENQWKCDRCTASIIVQQHMVEISALHFERGWFRILFVLSYVYVKEYVRFV